MQNTYSSRWFDTFLGTIDASVVDAEVAFLVRQLPVADSSRLLDLCCGPGRHTLALHARSYAVVGLDRDASALSSARARAQTAAGGDVELVRADMEALPLRDGSFDAVICMWQSFGHLDAAGNRRVLAQMHDVVRVGGRIILDVYNRSFHEQHLSARTIRRGGACVLEERSLQHGRLCVRLRYEGPDDSATDEFEWALYGASDLAAMGRDVGLATAVACTGFDERRGITADDPRMQLVFERVDTG